jgi:hypothetical protein
MVCEEYGFAWQTIYFIGFASIIIGVVWILMKLHEFVYDFWVWRSQLRKIRDLYETDKFHFMFSGWDRMFEDIKYVRELRNSGFKVKHK